MPSPSVKLRSIVRIPGAGSVDKNSSACRIWSICMAVALLLKLKANDDPVMSVRAPIFTPETLTIEPSLRPLLRLTFPLELTDRVSPAPKLVLLINR